MLVIEDVLKVAAKNVEAAAEVKRPAGKLLNKAQKKQKTKPNKKNRCHQLNRCSRRHQFMLDFTLQKQKTLICNCF